MPNESTSPSPHEQSFDPRSRPAATGRGAPPPSAARNGRPSAWRIMDPVRSRIHVAMALATVSSALSLAALGFLGLFAFFDLINELDDIGQGGYRLPQAVLYVLLGLPSHIYELMPVAARMPSFPGSTHSTRRRPRRCTCCPASATCRIGRRPR